MNRKTKRERLQRVRQASVVIAQLRGERGTVYNPNYVARILKQERRKLLNAWRMGSGRLPTSLANYRYKMAKRRERATQVGTSFGRNSYHRFDAW